ncbi:MAG TPA: hypothetical protein VFQ24_04735, partial [Terriglobia bacterium]|nr:hypothetical protein [Terriglobia bacterium]
MDLEPGIGAVPAQGIATINPKQTTTYTLTVKGSGGTSRVSVTVKVVAPQSGGTSGGTSGSTSGGTSGTSSGASGSTSGGTSSGTSGGTSGSTSSGTPQPAGVQLSPGDDIGAAVKANPTSTTFVLSPGVYRMQSVVPKDGDIFSGQSGATLVGAAIIDPSSWRSASSGVWEAQANGVTALASPRGVCDSQHPACMYPEDLFFDSKPLKRVASLSAVGPGSWYLDYSTEKVYVGSDPGGHTVELSEAHAAFWGSASNVS